MKLLVKDKQAYMHLHDDYYLCLGDRWVVQKAQPAQLAMIVQEAMAWSDYNQIQEGKRFVLH